MQLQSILIVIYAKHCFNLYLSVLEYFFFSYLSGKSHCAVQVFAKHRNSLTTQQSTSTDGKGQKKPLRCPHLLGLVPIHSLQMQLCPYQQGGRTSGVCHSQILDANRGLGHPTLIHDPRKLASTQTNNFIVLY